MEGRGAVTLRDLLDNASRMRPDRLVVTEVGGDEVFNLFKMMNTGYDGTLFSIHANSIHDALARLEVLAQLGSPGFPRLGLRELAASAIDVILYQEHLPDGSRKIIKIAEVNGMQEGEVAARALFGFRRTGRDEEGRIQGVFTATGVVPHFLQRLEELGGVENPLSLFACK
jgi:pilus assembly protein CpaF